MPACVELQSFFFLLALIITSFREKAPVMKQILEKNAVIHIHMRISTHINGYVHERTPIYTHERTPIYIYERTPIYVHAQTYIKRVQGIKKK